MYKQLQKYALGKIATFVKFNTNSNIFLIHSKLYLL